MKAPRSVVAALLAFTFLAFPAVADTELSEVFKAALSQGLIESGCTFENATIMQASSDMIKRENGAGCSAFLAKLCVKMETELPSQICAFRPQF